MQIDTQPLQVNARRLNVPRVLYGVGGSAVSFSNFNIYVEIFALIYLILRMFETAGGTWSENNLVPQRRLTAGPLSISLPTNSTWIKLEIECVRCPVVANN